jgi:hypothetical protein
MSCDAFPEARSVRLQPIAISASLSSITAKGTVAPQSPLNAKQMNRFVDMVVKDLLGSELYKLKVRLSGALFPSLIIRN